MRQGWEEANRRSISEQVTTVGNWCSVPLGTSGRWSRTLSRVVPPERQGAWACLHQLLCITDWELLQGVNSLALQAYLKQHWPSIFLRPEKALKQRVRDVFSKKPCGHRSTVAHQWHPLQGYATVWSQKVVVHVKSSVLWLAQSKALDSNKSFLEIWKCRKIAFFNTGIGLWF